jgi:hypothetical protein
VRTRPSSSTKAIDKGIGVSFIQKVASVGSGQTKAIP